MTVIRHDAIVSWFGPGGHSLAHRPVRCVTMDEAHEAADRLWGKVHAFEDSPTGIEAVVYRIKFDETRDAKDKPTLRETQRALVGRLDANRCWFSTVDMPVAEPEVAEAWIAALRDDVARMKTGPAYPPDHVKRAGKDAISDWYKARMDDAHRRHLTRSDIVRKAIDDWRADR
jgi:hypothetical protein